ncbi:uncharacterized protein J3D65DRAFT_236261 [Phyllosticta citribraziliensis]|uniref:Uncharacterized protein n=1 Tax=Phyllosticta citribraziliensis TaxID=989973 RepID=A0ABR1LZ43_9PEZI
MCPPRITATTPRPCLAYVVPSPLSPSLARSSSVPVASSSSSYTAWRARIRTTFPPNFERARRLSSAPPIARVNSPPIPSSLSAFGSSAGGGEGLPLILSFAWRHAPAMPNYCHLYRRVLVTGSQGRKSERAAPQTNASPPPKAVACTSSRPFLQVPSRYVASQNSSALTSTHPCGVGQTGDRRIGLLQPWMGCEIRVVVQPPGKKTKKKKETPLLRIKKVWIRMNETGLVLLLRLDARGRWVGMPSIAPLLLLLLLLSRLVSIMGRRRQLSSSLSLLTCWCI